MLKAIYSILYQKKGGENTMNRENGESQEGLTEDEIQANKIQAWYNAYDLSGPEERRKMEAAMNRTGPEYYPSEELWEAANAVSALEEFRGREQAIKDVQTQRAAAKKPEGKGPRRALSIWAHMGKFLKRKE